MHQKHGEVNDSLDREQAGGGLKWVDFATESGSTDVQEDAHEQRRPASPKETKREDPPTPTSADVLSARHAVLSSFVGC